MNLINFKLSENTDTIEIQGLNYSWDLHSAAYFSRIEHDVVEDYIILEWGADDEENPWGDPDNDAFGCQMVFRGIRHFSISPRNADAERDDDLCLAGISKCDTKGEKNHAGENFGLLFEFHSGQKIMIDAESAELCAIGQEHPFSRN